MCKTTLHLECYSVHANVSPTGLKTNRSTVQRHQTTLSKVVFQEVKITIVAKEGERSLPCPESPRKISQEEHCGGYCLSVIVLGNAFASIRS